nr:ORF in dsRNA satellite [Trichomonas vaginalis virus]
MSRLCSGATRYQSDMWFISPTPRQGRTQSTPETHRHMHLSLLSATLTLRHPHDVYKMLNVRPTTKSQLTPAHYTCF